MEENHFQLIYKFVPVWKILVVSLLLRCYMLASLVSLQQVNVKKSEKLIKMVDIEEENLHIFE